MGKRRIIREKQYGMRTIAAVAFFVLLFVLANTTGILASDGTENTSRMYATFWALVPSIVAITLALITKEVYSSLFVGIVVGGLFYTNFNPEQTVLHIFNDGIISVLSDTYNVGILIFLVILGTMVSLIRRHSDDGHRNISRQRSAHSSPVCCLES